MSIGVESSRFQTEVDYTTTIYLKPKRKELDNMGNAEKYVFGKIEETNIESWEWKTFKTNYSS